MDTSIVRTAIAGWDPRTTPFERQVEDWDSSISALDEENVDADTLPVLIDILEGQLARAAIRMERTDTKAALVLPAIGILAGIIGPNVRRSPFEQESPWLFAGAAAMVLFAGLSVILAVLALRPVHMSNGPNAAKVVLAADDPLDKARCRYLGRLGFAVKPGVSSLQREAWRDQGNLQVGWDRRRPQVRGRGYRNA